MRALIISLLLHPSLAFAAEAAEDRLQHALARMQLAPAPAALEIAGEGWTDLGVRLQGTLPFVSEQVVHRERWGIGGPEGPSYYETHSLVNPDADEHYRFVYERGGHMLVADRLAQRAFWVPADPDQRLRYLRVAPHRLLAELIAGVDALQQLDAGVRAVIPGHEPLDLSFDDEGLLRAVSYRHALPVYGDTTIRFEYLPYREVPGFGRYPSGHRILLGDAVYREVRYTAVAATTALDPYRDLREAGIEVADPPPPRSVPDAGAATTGAATPMPAATETIAPGVHLVQGVRGGFAALIVEFPDHLVVVDAPAGYHELQMLPAVDWAGPHPVSWTGERLLATARAVAPDKPVRYLVLTHHHQDHAGGARPFIAAGATIIASAETAEVVQRAASYRSELEPDALDAAPREPRILVLDSALELADGERRLRIEPVPDNPHAAGMLMVVLPEHAVIFQSDLFNGFGAAGPEPARTPIMRWFAGWLEARGHTGRDDLRVYGSHGRNPADLEQLRRAARGGD